jgi:hypothetical protein
VLSHRLSRYSSCSVTGILLYKLSIVLPKSLNFLLEFLGLLSCSQYFLQFLHVHLMLIAQLLTLLLVWLLENLHLLCVRLWFRFGGWLKQSR